MRIFEGVVVAMSREQVNKNGEEAIYTTGRVQQLKEGDGTRGSVSGIEEHPLVLFGYEPKASFKIGQRVTVEVEDVT